MPLPLTERRQEKSIERETQERAILRPLLLDLIELRDRLEISGMSSKAYRPNWFEQFFKHKTAFIMSINEGQTITLRRVDQLLSNYEVLSINTIHQAFDPRCMRAIAIQPCSELPNGVVISEQRKGFTWKNEVLRIAEVTVNKLEGLDHA